MGPVSGGEDFSATLAYAGPPSVTNLATADTGAQGGILGAIFGEAANSPPATLPVDHNPFAQTPQGRYWSAQHGIDSGPATPVDRSQPADVSSDAGLGRDHAPLASAPIGSAAHSPGSDSSWSNAGIPFVSPLAQMGSAFIDHVRAVNAYNNAHPTPMYSGPGMPHPQIYHTNWFTGKTDVIPAVGPPPDEAAAANNIVSGIGNAVAAPFVAFHEAWDPPLHPPPDSNYDDAGQIYVKDKDGEGHSRLWSDVDPAAAAAYYEQERRRAAFAPSMGLAMLGGGASFAERGAAGIAGGRLTQRFLRNRILSGQDHHGISKKIFDALEQAPGLAGVYRYRDPRFATRAINNAAHRGYQTWHRELDDEISSYIRQNQTMTSKFFERYLKGRYTRPDLRVRFPNGL